jgi:hypothetical protein
MQPLYVEDGDMLRLRDGGPLADMGVSLVAKGAT